MLSIFPCVGWPSIYLLWRNIYVDLLPIFVFFYFSIELHLENIFSCSEMVFLLKNVYLSVYLATSDLKIVVGCGIFIASCGIFHCNVGSVVACGLSCPQHVKS